MDIIARAQQLCPDRSLTAILTDLGLPLATYYRWQERAQHQQLADRVVVPAHTALPPTPQEIECVVQGAHRHLLLGYKRLAYALMAENRRFCGLGWCATFSIAISCWAAVRQCPSR